MKKLAYITFLTLVSYASWADESSPKYQKGDCITPTHESYSWFGEYASVEAYSKVEGFGLQKNYILAFPRSPSNSVIFEKQIENVTKKVDSSKCGN